MASKHRFNLHSDKIYLSSLLKVPQTLSSMQRGPTKAQKECSEIFSLPRGRWCQCIHSMAPFNLQNIARGPSRAPLFPKRELVLNWNTLLILFHQELRLKVFHLSHRIPRSSESYVTDDHSSSEDQPTLKCWSKLNLKSHIDSNCA